MKHPLQAFKRLIPHSSLLLLAVLTLLSCSSDRDHVLKIYNWADYIDETVLDDFKEWYLEQTGEEIEIVYQLFDINEVMLAKIEQGHDDYDVVCPSEYIIERMLQRDLLLPIDQDFGTTPNYIQQNMSPYCRQMLKNLNTGDKDATDYAVGYMWGTTGFLYNPKFVTDDEVSTWRALENPRFRERIFVKDAFRDVYSVVMTMLREDEIKSGKISYLDIMLDASDESIQRFEDYMSSPAVRRNVAGWEQDFGKEEMTRGKAWLNLSWSGDAQWAIDEAADVGVELRYAVPREGSNVWSDGWVIPRYARNVKAARYFINFLCRSDIAVRNMDEIGYVSCIATPEVLEAEMDEEYDSIDVSYLFGDIAAHVPLNPVMYPDQSVIDRCGQMHDSGDRTEQMLMMWSRVKGNETNPYALPFVIIAFVASLSYGLYRRHHHRRRTTEFYRK